MKRISILLACIALALNATAQGVNYRILHETDTTLKANLGGVILGSRDARYFRYEYPSKDSDGKAVTISGVILVPSDILNGSTPCDGVILYNHPTIGDPTEAPSQGGLTGPDAMLANPLRPNYILVMSDYIGYGSSIDHPICYLAGDTNARNSLDGLLAARQLFSDRKIPQGKYLFNMGYSQGATESMYVAKLRDMEYKDKGITFDKTFVGGGMLDCERAYTEFVKKDQCDAINDVAMFLISVNENFHMGIKYTDLFQEPLGSRVHEVLKTKDKGTLSEIGVSRLDYLHELLQPDYMNLDSEPAKALAKKLSEIKIANGWEPDLTQRYYLEHSRHDNYVPVQCARSLLTWMRTKGFTASLVPGKTNLQTCMVVFKLGHQPAGIVWAIQTMAAIQFWPVAYYEGEQNRYYHDLVKDLDIMKVLTTMEKWGLDVRKLVNISFASRQNRANLGPLFSLIPGLKEALAKVDLTPDDLSEMLEDSGITEMDVVRVATYLLGFGASVPEQTGGSFAEMFYERASKPLFLPNIYECMLSDWFMLGGYDVDYNQWGWSDMSNH